VQWELTPDLPISETHQYELQFYFNKYYD
jgi:hypothetical protein